MLSRFTGYKKQEQTTSYSDGQEGSVERERQAVGSWERELTPPEFFCREGHGGNGVCQRTCCVPELAEMNSGESARRCIP